MKVIEELKERAQSYQSPDGQQKLVVDYRTVAEIAARKNQPLRDVEITALKEDLIPLKYERNLGTVGLQGQIELLRSRVAVVGLGGLGGFVSELLARTGVGHLVLIDDDVYDESNLNRQLHSSIKSIGDFKAKTTADRLQLVNPATEIEFYQKRFTQDSAHLLEDCDLVLDCLDSTQDRFRLQKSCEEQGVTMIHGAIAGRMGQIAVIEPAGPGLESLYGPLEDIPDQGVELELGNLGATAAAIAAFEVQEAIKYITDTSSPLDKEMLLIDMATGRCERVALT